MRLGFRNQCPEMRHQEVLLSRWCTRKILRGCGWDQTVRRHEGVSVELVGAAPTSQGGRLRETSVSCHPDAEVSGEGPLLCV